MIPNQRFVEATRQQQERMKMTQESFARFIDSSQSALSKFYAHGVKDNLLIKILRKFPHLVIYFSEEPQ